MQTERYPNPNDERSLLLDKKNPNQDIERPRLADEKYPNNNIKRPAIADEKYLNQNKAKPLFENEMYPRANKERSPLADIKYPKDEWKKASNFTLNFILIYFFEKPKKNLTLKFFEFIQTIIHKMNIFSEILFVCNFPKALT